MSCIDLHIHTTASDGTDTPRAAVEKAASLGLAAVSITDHDSVSGVPEDRIARAAFGPTPDTLISSLKLFSSLEVAKPYSSKIPSPTFK